MCVLARLGIGFSWFGAIMWWFGGCVAGESGVVVASERRAGGVVGGYGN